MQQNQTTANNVRILLVPGGGGSGPDHWQTHWQTKHPYMERVVQENWHSGTRKQWVHALDKHIKLSDQPTILVAHSLGNMVLCHWAIKHTGPIIGALLVAPADVDAKWADAGELYQEFHPVPVNTLPFPSILVASTDDPYITQDRAQELATAWGAHFHLVGALGHIGSDSKLADWPDGFQLLQSLIRQSC